jgi:predicted metal-dependent HD superfamily phosphohydrolase
VEDLLAAWNQLIARHTADPGATGAGQRLLDAWADPRRTYHCVAHLRDVLNRVEELAAHAEEPDAVRLAAWYHDAVYAGLPDDEERSAQRAEQELAALGVAPQLVDEVARLVRMTVTHDPARGDRNAEVLSDADLSALALPAEHYRRNTAAIRVEYAHISDDVFRKGRVQVLVAMLECPALFRTDHGHQEWEDAARANMRTELDYLSGG